MNRQVFTNWNKQALIDWIELERVKGTDYRNLENALRLDYGVLDWWRTGLVNELTPDHLQAIADYRGWSLAKVREWLDIK
ncbi:hypothetical protein [Pseudanabaena sp. FACHB-2040]|uniref:hypothetical protein n=1 Tax=Pseudanabaena sp. FACHB-2040 TaxID=2692859 RepID=UPI0016855E0C|nr:hypothetical protein [Pseudanabaena sp. FACHB-2040]MBD2257019.1 hypothetical protein [Pseudanabaena sp. FACHB-2040]